MKKIAIVHYMPLEYYPPITNMLDVIVNEDTLNVRVWSTKNIKDRIPYSNNKLNKIIRTQFPKPHQNRFFRLFHYIWFNIKVFLELIRFRPDVVFYYETYSVGPVYLYLKFFGKNKKLIVHYHEYFDQAWYNQGMALVKLYYNYEKKYLLEKAEWISHTNSFRIDLFKKEHKKLDDSKLHVVSNFPPRSWGLRVNKRRGNEVQREDSLKIVYIGSLSLEHTFIEEFCSWVIARKGKVHFDIFAYNSSDSLIAYLNQLNTKYIRFYEEGIAYDEIPKILSNYDVGTILYKATTPNAKYCASNKLFEYLVCGLDVWVSKEQEGTKPFINYENRPLVRAIDFNNIEGSIIKDYYDSLYLPRVSLDYSCEKELKSLIQTLKS